MIDPLCFYSLLCFHPPSLPNIPLFRYFLVRNVGLTILIFGVFRLLDEPLRTDSAPSGIVSFELAGQVESAQAMINSWDADARLFAAFGLGFDYLFMPAYALALSLGLLLAINDRKNRYGAFAAWMGWGVLAATLFDAVENYALWRELIGPVVDPFPQIAAFCAAVKFILLIVGLVTALSAKLFAK
jgi:hypothetical protein